ncbi:MAG: DNA translocase FtsK 4TM domain-containing protein [Planctomycetota bacterium]
MPRKSDEYEYEYVYEDEEAERSPYAAAKATAWAVIALAWVLVTLALVSYDPADAPTHFVGVTHERPANWVGTIGATVAHEAFFTLGPGVWVLLVAVAVALGWTAASRRLDQPAIRATGVLLMTAACSGLAAVGTTGFITGYTGRPEGPGGLIGVFLHDELVPRFATLGAMLILAGVFWVGSILAADRWALALPRWMGEGLLRLLDISRDKMPGLPQLALSMPRLTLPSFRREPRVRANDLDDAIPSNPKAKRSTKRKGRDTDPDDPDHIDESAGGFAGTESLKTKRRPATEKVANEDFETDDQIESEDAPAAYVASKNDDALPASDPKAALDQDALREKMAKMPINFARKETATELPRAADLDLSEYAFPSLDLLEDPEGSFQTEMEFLIREQAQSLEMALQQYKIDGTVVNIDSGPVITLFEVRLAPGTKVARINAVDSDIARALKAPNIRVVPNMAGKDTVGIEVPNAEKERVRMKELMSSDPDKLAKMKLPMFLGKDASGNPLVQDLNAMPHMLIAGTTGSGKSVCMNSIIMSFLYTKRPDELKLVLVDPKMVEMSQFKSIPHLMCPVVTEMSKAAAILEWAVTKMDERYELLAEAGVRDIASYNQLDWDEIKERIEPSTPEEEARIPRKLPYLVFIIDELADLMMTNKEVESHIVRIAQKARAVGLHLILATQRPSANVVTGLIKSNMPCRVCMKVNSGMDSRIVLDTKGGELLLGHGDMLFLSPRSSELVRAQGTLVDDQEIRKSVKFLKDVSAQAFEPQLVQMRAADAEDGGGEGFAERDELFDKAVEVVIETKRGSVSLLQRRLTIGYSRASRIIEEMERFGIIGGHKTAQAREVLVSPEEWAAMQELAARESHAPESADADPGVPASAGTHPDENASASEEQPDEDANEIVDTLETEIDEDQAEFEEVEDEEANDEEGDDVEYEYVDEDGNPITAEEVAEYEEAGDEEDDEWEEADDQEDEDTTRAA